MTPEGPPQAEESELYTPLSKLERTPHVAPRMGREKQVEVFGTTFAGPVAEGPLWGCGGHSSQGRNRGCLGSKTAGVWALRTVTCKKVREPPFVE